MAVAVAVLLGVAGLTGGTPANGADVGGQVGVPVTHLGHVYAAAQPPTADKPQSKLWYLDGAWWALMVQAGGTRVTIHELMPDHRWRDTGTLVDGRADNTGDALWSSRDGRLYVASRAPGSTLQVNAFTYSPASRSWSVAAGFPTTVASGGASESASIDQDSLGRLWVTYTRAGRVWVARSDTQQRTWTAGFQPAVADTVIANDDLSALIAFDGSVGVLYSDQQSGGFHFAIHDDDDPDGVWRSEDIAGMPYLADDHINLKQLVGDPQGRVFAAIKTSADENPSASPADPLVGVLTRTPGADGTGTWEFAPAGTLADDHTRPLIMVDATNKELYFFATAPMKGGDIFYKKTPLTDVSFGTGRGERFIDTQAWVNNATGAKDPVTADTGLVILAVAHGKKQYVHGEMRLAGSSTPTEPTPTEPTPTEPTPTEPTPTGPTPTEPTPTEPTPTEPTPTEPTPTDPTPTGPTAPGPGGDGVPPTVTVTEPAPGSTGVTLWSNLKATFSEPVQGVNGTTFTLVDRADGSVVAAQVTQVGTSTSWLLNPDAKLVPDTAYSVRLVGGETGIRDLAGTPLVTTGWDFVTGPPPKVGWQSPKAGATGVSRSVSVNVTFSEPVQGVTAGTFTLADPSGTVVDARVLENGGQRKWVLDPTAPLAARTTYSVTVHGGPDGIADLVGNPLATTRWSFTTGG